MVLLLQNWRFFSVTCAAKISVLAIYMLSYMGIFTCFVWCLLILFYYVIKMEIKQLKRFFFCLYFNPVLSRNSFTTSVLQMYIVGNLVQQNSTCILYFGYVTFWLCRTSDNSKYFLHSLGLWDNEVDLYFFVQKMLSVFYVCWIYSCILQTRFFHGSKQYEPRSEEQSDLGPYCLQYRLP